jgi:hypothetical protein
MVMGGTPMKNIHPATHPLNINLPDGKVVKLLHVCNLKVSGLPCVLKGHIVPDLIVASLIGIRILCKVGCIVVFTDAACYVMYNGEVILTGHKDPSTNLWVLPITPNAIKNQEKLRTSPGATPLQAGPCMTCAPQFPVSLPKTPPTMEVATFTHAVQTRAKAVKFSHQELCNPKILSLLKAMQKGFLKVCPNISEGLVEKYLNPSPPTAKGHMKQPKKGIRSTQIKVKTKGDIDIRIVPAPVPLVAPPLLPLFVEPWPYHGPAYGACTDATLIPNNKLIAYVLYFGAFADKISGVVYNDLTGNFPFMSIDGSICFFVLYHYKTNAILVESIENLNDCSIFDAYKEKFESLKAKGYKPKMNVLDNHATKYIKQFLTKKECNLQVVEPHNHRVNAAEHAIQTFKDAFIAALATTDCKFPLQLWDKLAP